MNGVISAHFNPRLPRTLEVANNPQAVTSEMLRGHLAERGPAVSIIGM